MANSERPALGALYHNIASGQVPASLWVAEIPFGATVERDLALALRDRSQVRLDSEQK